MMKLTFNKSYFLCFVLLFLTEVAIAVFFKTGFIRHTVGDFLVVILLYCFFKSFLKTSAVAIAMITLGIAYAVEFLQLTPFLDLLGLQQNKWATLVFGNSFSVQDLVAYTLGIAVIWNIDRSNFLLKKISQKNKKGHPKVTLKE